MALNYPPVAPTAIGFPTWAPECSDTERRSLVKINELLYEARLLLADQENDIDDIDANIAIIVADLQTILANLQTILTDLQTIITSLQTVLANLQTIITALNTVNTNLQTIITALNTVNTNLQTIITALNTVNTNLTTLTQAVKLADLVRVSSGAFVSHFVAFTGTTNLYQIDCFSIATITMWVFVFDGPTSGPPIYIAPIYSNSSACFATPSTFTNSVTVGMSTAPTSYTEDASPQMLVTATRRGP